MGGIVKSIGGIVNKALPIVAPGVALTKKMMEGGLSAKDFNDQIASLDPGQRPTASQFESITDNKTGLLKDNYKLSDGSGYSKLATDKLGTDIAKARDNAAAGGAQAQAQARTALASRGGITSGMAARLAMSGGRDQMAAQQGVTSQQVAGGQDIASKTFDIGREAEKANIGTMTQDQRERNMFNDSRYKAQMQEWAAGKAGQASMAGNQPKSAKGGVGGMVGGVLGK